MVALLIGIIIYFLYWHLIGLTDIVFSVETKFTLNGNLNNKNWYWDSKKSHNKQEAHKLHQKVNKEIVGPFINEVNVSRDLYLDKLQNYIIPALFGAKFERWTIQQDWTPPHCAIRVINHRVMVQENQIFRHPIFCRVLSSVSVSGLSLRHIMTVIILPIRLEDDNFLWSHIIELYKKIEIIKQLHWRPFLSVLLIMSQKKVENNQ